MTTKEELIQRKKELAELEGNPITVPMFAGLILERERRMHRIRIRIKILEKLLEEENK